MARWEDLFGYVLPEVPGAPEPVVEREVRNATIEFCEKSGVWQEKLFGVDTVDGQELYYLPVPPDSKLTGVPKWRDQSTAWYGDTRLAQEDRMRVLTNNEEGAEGKPQVFSLEADNQVRVSPVPTSDETDKLTFYVQLAPTRQAIQIPDWLFEEYQEAAIHGALSKLMSQPGKSWSNQAWQFHQREFRDWISFAKRKVLGGDNGGSVTAHQPQFGG